MRASTFRRSAASLCMLLLGLTSGMNAHAQPPDAPPPAATPDTKTAQQYYEEGAAAVSRGQLEVARDLFQKAWQRKQHWQIAANLGQVEFTLGKYRDATEHLAYFLHEGTDAPPSDRQKLKDLFDKARKKVGALRISTSPAGAEIRVDGSSVGRSPLKEEVFVEPGSRVVEARLDGAGTAKETATVAAGGKVEVNLRLANGATAAGGGGPAGVAGGGTGVSSGPGAAGGAAGSAAPVGSAVSPGTGTTPAGVNKTLVIAGVAGSAGMAVAGIVFAAISQAERTASRTAGSPSHFYQLQDLKVGFGWTSLISFVISGATAAATLAYAIPAKQPVKPRSGINANIVVGSQGIGATLTKSW